MALFSNYTDLQASVLAWHWNRDSTRIEEAIYLTHSKLNLVLRAPFMQKTTDLTISSYRIPAPADFSAVERLWIDGNWDGPLIAQTPDRIAHLRASLGADQPLWYGLEGEDADPVEQFVFAPDPGATPYTGKLAYYRRLPYFASGAATNTILTRWPFLYLYGATAELARFADDDEATARATKFERLFMDMVGGVNTATRKDALGPVVQMTPNMGYAI